MVGQFKRLVLIALLGVGAYATANDGQQPIVEYRKSPLAGSKMNELRLAALKPSTMDASAQLKTQTSAELAVVQVKIETKAESEKWALEGARERRDGVESLIQQLSHGSSDFSERYEYTDFEEGRFRYERDEKITAIAMLEVKFTELDALKHFVTTIAGEDDKAVTVDAIYWKLTAETQKKVKSELRRDALKELRSIGADYENAFGVVLKSMEDYKECNRGRFMFEEDPDDRSSMHDWKTIRSFFNAPGDEPKVGKVTSFLDVSCKFVAAECRRLASEHFKSVSVIEHDKSAMEAALAATRA